MRIKRYPMEEVLQDNSWLDKKWAEKDRLLSHFARYQCFPSADSRGHSCRYRVFSSRRHNVESSTVSLLQLLVLPSAVPILLLLSVPLFWMLLWLYFARQAFRCLFSDYETSYRGARDGTSFSDGDNDGGLDSTTPGSLNGTPYLPATPFASPSMTSWRDMFTSTGKDTNGGSGNGASPT